MHYNFHLQFMIFMSPSNNPRKPSFKAASAMKTFLWTFQRNFPILFSLCESFCFNPIETFSSYPCESCCSWAKSIISILQIYHFKNSHNRKRRNINIKSFFLSFCSIPEELFFTESILEEEENFLNTLLKIYRSILYNFFNILD